VYLAFEYVQGGEIFRLLRKENMFPNDVALFYITEIVLALEYLHR
jgi:protein kinase A/protein kinase X